MIYIYIYIYIYLEIWYQFDLRYMEKMLFILTASYPKFVDSD